jgi:hypothetical protein
MQKLTIIIGHELKQADATLDGETPDQTSHGQLFEYPKVALVGLLGPVQQEGRIYSSVGGKRYKVTALESDGKFTLEADF